MRWQPLTKLNLNLKSSISFATNNNWYLFSLVEKSYLFSKQNVAIGSGATCKFLNGKESIFVFLKDIVLSSRRDLFYAKFFVHETSHKDQLVSAARRLNLRKFKS